MPREMSPGFGTKTRVSGNYWHSVGVQIPGIRVGLACVYKLIHVMGLQVTTNLALLWFKYS
jgi:hypothetical protein